MPKSKPPRTRRPKPRRLCGMRKAMLDAIDQVLVLNDATFREMEDAARRFPSASMAKTLAKLRVETEFHRRELLESRADALGWPSS